MSHVYCPECGFQNPESANYCSKCGALLVREDAGPETTMSFSPEEGEEESGELLEEIRTEGPALVVRSLFSVLMLLITAPNRSAVSRSLRIQLAINSDGTGGRSGTGALATVV